MRNKSVRILLILIALVCFGVALYYPVSEYVQVKQNEESMDMLASLRDAGLQKAATVTEAPAAVEPDEPTPETETQAPEAVVTDAPEEGQPTGVTEPETTLQAPVSEATEPVDAPTDAQEAATASLARETTAAAGVSQTTAAVTDAEETAAPTGTSNANEPTVSESKTAEPDASKPAAEEPGATPTPDVTATPTAEPTPTPNRFVNTGMTFDELEKVPLDTSKILPQYKELYAINNDMVGWLTMPGTKVDYPVMQREDEEYYLSHDFFHKDNANGLLIMNATCDPYTPSYNLVISGHNRKNGTIFSNINEYYGDLRHYKVHKYIQFDSLMEERTYIVFAAFYSGVYEDGEEGFRYNADIRYRIDANQWLKQVEQYKLYDTGVDVAFGDQFLTLTTCNSSRRKNGRFVVVARRLREGETIEE